MPDTSLAILHAAFLIGSAVFALRHYSVSRSHKVLAGFLLVWFNLVLTGYGLSIFSRLNNLTLYFIVSCAIAAIGIWVVDVLLTEDTKTQDNPIALPKNDSPWDFSPLVIFSLSMLFIAIAASALIAIFYYPNNPDSIAYRFSRVFLYLGRGNLMHPAHHDPRISFYPFNAALAYVYFAIYKLDGRWFNFLGYAAWVISSLGVYVFARDMGGSRNGSFLASCIYALSPIVLVLATSTNDEVIAAAPVLLGLIFFHRWWYTGKFFEAVLGGIGVGLGAGTKLHIAFFGPAIALALFFIIINLYRNGHTRKFFKERLTHMMASAIITALLVCPFIIINFIETRHPLLPPNYAAEVLNKPFSAKVALINMTLFSAQLFLSPVPELVFSPDTGFKNRVFQEYNSFLNKNLFHWVDKNDHYSSEPYYYFQGVADPIGWWAFEQTEWLGFAPFLVLLSIILLWRYRRKENVVPSLWLLSAFFVWHFYKSASTKYIEAAATYYSYPFTICAAGLAIVWDRRKDMMNFTATAVTYLVIFVMFTHTLFDLNLFVCNVRRNLASLVLSQCSRENIAKLPLPAVVVNSLLLAGNVRLDTPMSLSVVQALQGAQKIHLFYSRWEFPLFSFMSKNPGARYTSSGEMSPEDDVLNVFLYSARSEFAHIPIQTGQEKKKRLTALGNMTTEFGTEYVFGKGNNVHAAYPASSGFIVLHPALKYDDTGSAVTEVNFSRAVMGADEADRFEYQLSQISPEGKEYTFAYWFSQDQLEQPRALPVPAAGGYLRVKVRQANDRGRVFESALPLKKGVEIRPLNINPEEIEAGKLAGNFIRQSVPPGFMVEGMGDLEGPYPQWDLPKVRWAKKPEVRIQFDNSGEKEVSSMLLSMSFRPQVRSSAGMTLTFNGTMIKSFKLTEQKKWHEDRLTLMPKKGRNIIVLSFVASGEPQPLDSLYMLFKVLSLGATEVKMP
jgi:hypothetical protein